MNVRYLRFLRFIIPGILLCILVACANEGVPENKSGGIQVSQEYPRYWQFDGEPVILLGATDDDNLFQWTGSKLTDHLDSLVNAGGNYIRNTMSSRDSANIQPFARQENGLYDLNRWNDKYWNRFENLLKETASRDIVVQVEFWAYHDLFDEFWEFSPWNPVNNVNYDTVQTELNSSYENNFETEHDFFFSIPDYNNDEVVLNLQRRYFEKILSFTVNYDHILYCITNEIFPQYPHEWGWYWADVIRQHAERAGRQVNITEMYWQTDFTHEQHLGSLRHPEMYDYFEGSQNSARSGQENWENMQYVYSQLASSPRPINSVKIYGSDAGINWTGGQPRAIDRFWRNMIGGCASSRFHRPPHGIGLSDASRASIRSMRMFVEKFDIMRAQPDSDFSLLSNRETNEAYATAIADEQYAIYFPAGGEVGMNVRDDQYAVEWLHIDESRWTTQEQSEAIDNITLTVPSDARHLALITRTE